MTQSTEVAIIGAGVIGLAIAERLLAEGREVALIDPMPPGSGASYGNAGTIADYAVLPVGTPDVLRNLPSLLFDTDSPLSLRRAALPRLAPWLLRFARQSLPAAAKRNAIAIAALVSDACPLWEDLALRLGASEILQKRGCLYLYETAAAFQSAAKDMAFRRSLGVSVDLITPQELHQLEPNLPETQGGAAFFPKAIFMADPGQMVQSLAQHVLSRATLIRAKAETLRPSASGTQITGPGFQLNARHVVLAAGAHSRALARQAGDKIPLDTERGYHVEWDMEVPRLTRPTCPSARGFYLCPMTNRLRVAGTVELGGLTLPPSPHRIAKLVTGARAIFPDLPAPSRDWMGFRPSIPDSLPVIGASAQSPQVIHAFGHGHIGLTLAPATAIAVADAVAGRPLDPRFAPCRPNRF
jgi:D-hydroxyproline dehydrogenase